MRFPFRFAIFALLVITACQGFLNDLGCSVGAQCDPNKAVNTPGSCANLTLPAGSHTGSCQDTGICTDPTDACIDDACISCGQTGQVCCDQQGSTGCTGSVCVTGSDDFPTCHNDCGSQNHVCCPGTGDPCPTSGYCDGSTNQCVPDNNDPTSGGEYFVYLLTPGKCAVDPYHYNATSDTDAQTKANTHLAQANVGLQPAQRFTLGPLKTTPTHHYLCEYPVLSMNVIDPVTLDTYNNLDLSTCKNETAGGINAATWGSQVNGSCPAIPQP